MILTKGRFPRVLVKSCNMMQSVRLADERFCQYPAADEPVGFCGVNGVGRGGGGELQAFCTPGSCMHNNA